MTAEIEFHVHTKPRLGFKSFQLVSFFLMAVRYISVLYIDEQLHYLSACEEKQFINNQINQHCCHINGAVSNRHVTISSVQCATKNVCMMFYIKFAVLLNISCSNVIEGLLKYRRCIDSRCQTQLFLSYISNFQTKKLVYIYIYNLVRASYCHGLSHRGHGF